MKKQGGIILLSVCLVFMIATVGIFIGRNSGSNPIYVSPLVSSSVSEPTDTDPTALLVNINTADSTQLQQLPGIGEILSQRILEYRDAAGGFTSLEQLLDVEGIGSGRLEQLLPYITTGG